MNSRTLPAIVIGLVVVGWMFWVMSSRSASDDTQGATPTASLVDGKQTIDLTARGGYTPRVVVAKAGVPTILRVTTKGTFDCSASLVIPKLSYQKFLPSTGTEEIAISADQAQGTLQGTCAMGMYNFQIRFQ